MAGTHFVPEAVQAHPRQSRVVVKMLEDHGIPVADLGPGQAKTLDRLAAAVHRGASRLLPDPAEHKKFVRVVDVVLLLIKQAAREALVHDPRPSRGQCRSQVRVVGSCPGRRDGHQHHGWGTHGARGCAGAPAAVTCCCEDA